MRFFFAMWPDDDTRARLAAAARAVLPPGCRAVPPENYHLTLVFVGSVPDERVPLLERCLREVAMPAVTLTFGTTGRFARAAVGWLGPNAVPAPLLAFQRALAAAVGAAGFDVDARRYAPHLTIARPCRTALPAWQGPPITWAADRFVLCRSDAAPAGVRYAVVAVSPAASMR